MVFIYKHIFELVTKGVVFSKWCTSEKSISYFVCLFNYVLFMSGMITLIFYLFYFMVKTINNFNSNSNVRQIILTGSTILSTLNMRLG